MQLLSLREVPRVCKPLLAVFLALSLCGCATTSFESKMPNRSETTPVTAVYVYSFLDLREGSLGKNFLNEVRSQLDQALTKDGVRTKQLWFNDSPLRTQFSLEATGPNLARTSMRVPVAEVVNATREDERAFGASHRLIVFPASITRSNSGSTFSVRWDLVDSQTNEITWTTTSRSHHMKWFLGDENPRERAGTFVEGFVTELHKAKIIKSHGT
jgi:hypothetical protein